MNLLTIDSATTRDIDDAIGIEKVPSGWRLTVCIADVAGTVTDGSDEDLYARARVETKYHASGNSPMLPRELSEGDLSLWAGRKRKVIAITMDVSDDLGTINTTLSIAKIRSGAKLAYTDVPAILADTSHAHHEMISYAAAVSMALLTCRRDAGAMALYDLNNGWISTEEGFLRRIKSHDEALGQIIVQEFMILANAEVAKWAIERDVPLLFRNHVARAATPPREELLRQLNEAVHTPFAALEAYRTRTHMLLGRADYGADVRGHYGLNLPAYLHFTSPIRRYADLVNHRQVRAAIREVTLPYTRERVAELGTHINAAIKADEDARSEYMRDKANQRATSAVESRRLDGLAPKDFERVVKVQVRSGGDPAESFTEAFARRAADHNVPTLCAMLVLTQAPTTDGWKPVRAAALAMLTRHPEDATSVLMQASQGHGWSVPAFDTTAAGLPPVFTAKVSVTLGGVTLQGKATHRAKKLAEQRAAIVLLASYAGLAVTFEDTAPVVAFDESKEPTSALLEWTQKTGTAPPTFTYDVSGPPHAPTVVCECIVAGVTAKGTASNKQTAKREAAKCAIEMLKGARR